MTALQLLSMLRDLDVSCGVDAEGNWWIDGPQDALTPNVLATVDLHRPELLRILDARPRCPRCSRRLDEKSRCWTKACNWRTCPDCGRSSGSVFLERCLTCEYRHAHRQNEEA